MENKEKQPLVQVREGSNPSFCANKPQAISLAACFFV